MRIDHQSRLPVCLHRLLMSTGCKSSHSSFLDVSRSNGGLRISGWIGQLSCLTIFSTSLSVAAFLRRAIELCQHQSCRSTFKVISAITVLSVSRPKCSLLFWRIECSGDLIENDFADNLERPLKVISCTRLTHSLLRLTS